MKKLYIHIGTDKTGSTSIQKTINNARPELLKTGVDYIECNINHGYIYSAIKSGNWDEVENVVKYIHHSDSKVFILSCEGLYKIDERSLGKLLWYFSSLNVEVVLYLRSRQEKMRSGLGQRMKFGQGYNKQVLEKVYREKDFFSLFNHSSFDYDGIVSKWERSLSTLKSGGLTLDIYDKKSLRGGDVVCDFLYKIGLSDDETDAVLYAAKNKKENLDSANPSLSPAAQDMLALFFTFSSDRKKYQIVREIIDREDDPAEKKHSRLPDNVIENFSNNFSCGDKKLARKYFDREELFSSKTSFKHIDANPESFQNLARKVLSESDRIVQTGQEFDEYIPALKKAASSVENSDIELSIKLLKLAKAIRPGGAAIKMKLDNLENKTK